MARARALHRLRLFALILAVAVMAPAIMRLPIAFFADSHESSCGHDDCPIDDDEGRCPPNCACACALPHSLPPALESGIIVDAALALSDLSSPDVRPLRDENLRARLDRPPRC